MKIKKLRRDLALIFYDDLSFHALSMVRITFFLLVMLFAAGCVVSFCGVEVGCLTQIVSAIGIVAGMYVGKRFTWKQEQLPPPPRPNHGED